MKSLLHVLGRCRSILLAVLLGAAGLPAQAADTDLFFTGASGTASRPNVLIILDNTANWSPMFSAEMLALSTVLKNQVKPWDPTKTPGEQQGAFRIGLMMFVETGGGNDTNDGSYVRFAVRDFDPYSPDPALSNPAEVLIKLVEGLDRIGDQSNNAIYGLAMNEAYKYFKGGVSYSQVQLKRDYRYNVLGRPAGSVDSDPPVIDGGVPSATNRNFNAFSGAGSFTYQSPVADNCSDNHIIWISNGKGNDNASATGKATDFLIAEGGDATQITLNPNGSQGNVADEWARFMSRLPLSNETNKPLIHTHAILVQDAGAPGGQYPDHWETLLRSMSEVHGGKGKFQKTDGSTAQITAALEKSFADIQAVSSVFTSSTLPINVNVRGTFLNQVYMGVFRPEAQGTPRWTGNLKLYRLAYDQANDRTYLADRTGAEAEDGSSGFILPSAVSFWTTASNFWVENFESSFYFYSDVKPVSDSSDSPDGDFVEKGGAAQRLRDTYPSSIASAPRPIYTSIAGAALVPFATGNTAIDAAKLALGEVRPISSLTRTGTDVIALSPSHGFSNNDSITISGSTVVEYNGAKTITFIDADTFRFSVTETPPASATGGVGYRAGAGSFAVTSITHTGTTATVNAPGHTFANGQTVTISGADQAAYNIAATIGGVVPGVSFTFAVAETPSTTIVSTGGNACPAASAAVTTCPTGNKSGTVGIDSASRTAVSPTTTISAKNHGFSTGNMILIEGLSPADYNGRYSITRVDKDTFTYQLTVTPGPPGSSNGAITASLASTPVAVTTLTRSGLTVAGSTGTTAHNWNPGDDIVFSGMSEAAYNTTFRLATASVTSFTFTLITTGPAVNGGSASATTAGGVNREELINWVRGENRLYQDNPSGNAAHVRGYHHGDVLHSRPAVVNYGRDAPGASAPLADILNVRDVVVYYGANDGMLHAVKGGRDNADGLEKWAYIAEDHFPALKDLYTAGPPIRTSPRKYFFDGPISAYQKDGNADGIPEEVWLYATMRRGGRGIHALDVSDPDVLPPGLKWKKSNTSEGYSELGQTWSEVQPITISATTTPVVVFGMGYDPVFDDPNGVPASTTQPIVSSRRGAVSGMGRGLVVADAGTGDPVWIVSANPADGTGAYPRPSETVYQQADMCPIASDVSAVDLDQNGVVDRLYVADTCANIWRIDVESSNVASWSVRKLASLGGTGTELRKFLFRPDVVKLTQEPGKLAILIGSGDREAPYDTAVSNAFFMVKDDTATTCPNCGVTGSQLCERNALADPSYVSACQTYCDTDITTPGAQLSPTIDPTSGLTCFQACLVRAAPCTVGTWDHDSDATTPEIPRDVSSRGWKYTYPQTNGQFGEKTVNAPLTIGGTVFFGTNVPQSLLQGQVCGGLGQARLYQVEYSTGAPAYDPSGSGMSTYWVERPGGGFPPSPVGTVVTTDEGKTVEVVLSGSQVQKPPTQPLEKRYRIYWYKRLDR